MTNPLLRRRAVEGALPVAAASDDGSSKPQAYVMALALVAGVALLRPLFGLNAPPSPPFALFAIAVAASAAYGGLSAGAVAALVSILVVRLTAPASGPVGGEVLFAVEAFTIAAIVGRSVTRRRDGEAELDTARRRLSLLEERKRQATLVDAAFSELDAMTPDAAVLVLNEQAVITEWTSGAEGVYGYEVDQVVGACASMLLADGAASRGEIVDAIEEASRNGSARRAGTLRRKDGTRFSAEIDVRPIEGADDRLFTLAVCDLTRQRELDAIRASAIRAETLLRAEAEEARGQVAALERLTDPWLNNPNDAECISDLLERLRSAVEADGVGVIYNTSVRTRVITAQGIQPDVEATRPQRDVRRHQTGRMALIQNDAARVAQASVLAWPSTTTSLLVVPVVLDGKVQAVMEIVNERPRRATDWDLVLARITADRAATLIAHQEYSRNGAVA